MAKQPNIRFKGFTEEWKEKTVEEVSIRLDNLRIPIAASLRVAGDTPYYGANGIQDYVEGYTHDGENILIAEDGASDTDVYPVRITRGKIWVNNHAHVLRGINGVMSNPFLLYALLKTDFSKILVGGTRHKLTTKALNSTIISFTPDEKEQKAITQTLSLFDTIISQRETELEKLKNIKRGLLEKLFPKDGQTIPAIRFKGFDENWEPKILGNEIEETGTKNRNNLPLESYSITNEAGFIPQNEKFENGGYVTDADKTMYTIVPPQSFAYNPARINVGSIGYYNGSKDVIVSSLYIVFKTSEAIHDDFLMAWFKSDIFNHLIYTLQEGGVRQYFFYDKMVQCPILLPKTPEQEKIAKLVNSLNKTISLRERQLTLLKHTKQALLEQMFVNE